MELTDELAEARKQSIEEIARYIFPIEVQELDEQDMDISKSGNHILVCYCIAQNFGRVNFWKLVARHTNGRENFGKSSTTGLSCIVYMVTFKNLVGKILAGLDKFTKILHYAILHVCCVACRIINRFWYRAAGGGWVGVELSEAIGSTEDYYCVLCTAS